MTVFSVLDLVPVSEGKTPRDALRQSLELAQLCESLGYQRYWVAEHHNMVGIASAATSVVVGYLAGGTRTMRIGAGGIMLPNHSPLVIALSRTDRPRAGPRTRHRPDDPACFAPRSQCGRRFSQ